MGVVFELIQSFATTQNQSHVVLIIRSSSGVQLQMAIDVKWLPLQLAIF
jgi:hypothetical protein